MPLIFLFLVAMLTGIYFLSENSEASKTQAIVTENNVRVTNMLIYRNAVATYVDANPTYTGTVPDNSLALPSWFRKMHGVENYVSGGTGYIFSNDRPELAFLIAKKTESITVGIKKNGVLVHPSEGSTGIALPSSIPNDSVVILQ